ncbi:MAG TPA: PilN domain-containing protein [Vicinamibacteria bacterium]
MRPALNLASRPFRNERLPAALLALAAVVLGLVTLRHAFVLKDLLPGRVSALDKEALDLEQELAQLRDEEARLQGPRPDPERLNQWKALRGLVDQRAFSWTTLLASLEEVLPQGVKLVSIAPLVKDGRVTLDVSAVARRFEDRHQMLRALDESPEFEDVFLRTAGESERGEEFTCTTRYLPGVAPRPAAAEPAPEAAPSSPEESADVPSAGDAGGDS